MTVSIIHSGRLPLSRNASMTLRRLAIFLRLASLVAARISLAERLGRARGRRRCLSISRTASPPMPALELVVAVLVEELHVALLAEELAARERRSPSGR